MTLGLAYWILMLVWLVLGIYSNRSRIMDFAIGGNFLLLFLLLLLIGWQVFGAPIKT